MLRWLRLSLSLSTSFFFPWPVFVPFPPRRHQWRRSILFHCHAVRLLHLSATFVLFSKTGHLFFARSPPVSFNSDSTSSNLMKFVYYLIRIVCQLISIVIVSSLKRMRFYVFRLAQRYADSSIVLVIICWCVRQLSMFESRCEQALLLLLLFFRALFLFCSLSLVFERK